MLKAPNVLCVAILAALLVPGCVAQEDIILPSKYDRVAQANIYKTCVANATNSHFDETTQPEVIVRKSLASCSHFKHKMLTAYPEQWRENYIKEVDANLFQREIDWIVEARAKNHHFFR
jgi:hypothetical protein